MELDSHVQRTANIGALEHLARTWNPPETSGTITLDYPTDHSVRLVFHGSRGQRKISSSSRTCDNALLHDLSRGQEFARVVVDFLRSTSDAILEPLRSAQTAAGLEK